MLDSIYIADTSPYGEDCVCVGEDDYIRRAKEEGNRFIAQIRKHYGKEPGGSYLDLKKNPHDFGSYISIEFYFHTENSVEADYGFDVEGDVKNVLETWDKEFSA